MADSTPPAYNSYCFNFQGMQMRSSGLAGDAPFTWPSANLAIFAPFSLDFSYTVKRYGWINGATVSGNISIAIYSVPGFAQVTGSLTTVAMVGTGAFQWSVLSSPIVLASGYYSLGVSLSSGTGTIRGSTLSADQGRVMGLLEQASAHPLPSTATPAAFARANWPLMSIERNAS